jgi:tRNA(fMet)-specific endonuclease VapC
MAITATAFLLDTSAYSGFNRGDERLRPWFNTQNIISLPLIVIGELRAGFAAGSKTTENEQLLRRFLDSSSVQILPLTLETTKVFASLFLEVRNAGNAISTNDLWIAALAVEHNLPILTLDGDFQRIQGVEVIQI